MLSDGECGKGAVEGSASLSYQALLNEELQIRQPDPRHLVHADKGTLESVV